VGDEPTRRFERMQAEGNYGEAFYEHGLAVEAAEAVAQWMHRHVRRELGLADGQGKRYSPGYPAWPELVDQRQIWKLLDPEQTIGVSLTSADQMVPEQSTSAIVVHHPEAVYYTVRGAPVAAAG
jgi:5-methyltetrahydrofolate--homocysteine methyltransferase